MDENPYKAPQKQKKRWFLVPMREQPLLVIMLYLLPLAIALFFAMILSR